MLTLNTSTKFRKDLKTCVRRGYDLELLQSVIDTLRIPAPLPEKNRQHILSGNWDGYQECHMLPDWLLIYRATENDLYRVRTGTHADLFGK